MTNVQMEYFLHLMSTLVDQQVKQANALARISKTLSLQLDEQAKQASALNSLDGQIMDLSYHIRYGGGS